MSGPAVGVSLSGGGFRASLAGIGVLRALADLELLGNVRYVSSVSGGSWANGLLALNWNELAERDFTLEAMDDLIVCPFVEKITTKSLGMRMVRNMWKAIGHRTRTDLLADAFDAWFGDGRRLDDLPLGCRFIFNATNLNSGVRFGFERDRIGDHRAHYIRAPEMLIAEAVAASAALPGMLAVHHLRTPHNVYRRRDRPRLVDGAVYDNLGVEPFMQLDRYPLLVMLDAGRTNALPHTDAGKVHLRLLRRRQQVPDREDAYAGRFLHTAEPSCRRAPLPRYGPPCQCTLRTR